MKKGTSSGTYLQIFVILMLILGFGILIWFLSGLHIGDVTEKDICRDSVSRVGVTKVSNLDCKTSRVCISGGEKCEGFSYTITKKIDLRKPNAKEQIMDFIHTKNL